MLAKHKIFLRRIDLVDRKLFLFPEKELDRMFKVERNNAVYYIRLGLIEFLPDLYSYTDVEFEAELDTNLSIFGKEIPFIVETDNLKISSREKVALDESKETERIGLEKQIMNLFPDVLEAVNTLRMACKVALFRESVDGRIISQNIIDSQNYWGVDPSNSLKDIFSGNDTEFLFATFANLSLISFGGDADIEYRVSNMVGEEYEGVFKNGYKGLQSPNRFFKRLDEIQNLVDRGWTLETEVLLTSLEVLYSDNYRMAIFNAATLLELEVVKFWERKQEQLNRGSRENQETVARLSRQIKRSDSTYLERIIRIVLPEFINQDLVRNGNLERCITAWNIRNRLAHLYANTDQEEPLEITRNKAWSVVASIIELVDDISPPSP